MEPSHSPPMTPKAAEPEKATAVQEAGLTHDRPAESQGSSFGSFFSRLSSAVGLPLGFFQSRPEIRAWGETEVQDPSVQPRPDNAPRDYGSGLPGYPKHSCAYFDSTFGRSKASPEFVSLFTLLDVHDDKLLGPRLTGFPKCKVDYPPLPPRKLGDPSYDYRDLQGYQMDYHPYVNALMSPRDPARMYVRANWMVGYPYGVPAVEENGAF